MVVLLILLSFYFVSVQAQPEYKPELKDEVWYTVRPPVIKPLDTKDSSYFCEITSDGQIVREGYKNGSMLNGEVRLYKEGKLINIVTYKNDIPDGTYWAFFIPSGKAYMLGQYKEGKKDGQWFELNPDGKVIGVKEYKDDKQIK